MSKCKIQEALKYIETLYKQIPDTSKNKARKKALFEVFTRFNKDRARIQQEAAFLKEITSSRGKILQSHVTKENSTSLQKKDEQVRQETEKYENLTEKEDSKSETVVRTENNQARTLTEILEESKTTIKETSEAVEEPPFKEGYTILENMKTNADQTAAIDTMKEWYKSWSSDTFLLQGRGGTGKTTVINVLLRELGILPSQVTFATPTNKALKVLYKANKGTRYDSSGYYTTTQILAKKPIFDKEGYLRKFVPDPDRVPPELGKILVIDEASMVRSAEYDELLIRAKTTGTRIIFMGDHAQLPPIKDRKGRIRSVVFDKNRDTTTILTELMRQATDSPIIAFTNSIIDQVLKIEKALLKEVKDVNIKATFRKILWDGDTFSKIDSKGDEGVVLTSEDFNTILPSFLRDLKKAPTSTKLINYNNYKNKLTVYRTNQIREILYGERAIKEKYIPGEPLVLNDSYRYDLKEKESSKVDNGEEFEVISSEIRNVHLKYRKGKNIVHTETPIKVYQVTAKNVVTGAEIVFNQEVDENEINNLPIHEHRALRSQSLLATALSHGYIINTHRSQGSTYENVYLDLGNILGQPVADINTIIKSLYVAASRPSKKLVVMDTRPAAGNQIINPRKVKQIEEVPITSSKNKGEQADIINRVNDCKS